MNEPPIFIHSLFRAGSTYLFKVFRRSSSGYWCYQESLHESAIDANEKPGTLLQGRGEEHLQRLRHPSIGMPYFQELHDTWPAWKNTLSASAVYDGYFSPNADIGIPYLRALADAAKGRPVFQECRTASRIAAIKQCLGGYHIYLWRNPWDQWWSCKAVEYFGVANQLIINAPNPPEAVLALRAALRFEIYSYTDISKAFEHFSMKPLSAEESYLVFYVLWCLGLREGRMQAHLMLNIDRLSDSPNYRDEVQEQLKEAGIAGVDFSDCRVPQGIYLDQDSSFFVALEGKVHDWLKVGGWTQDDLDQMQALRQQFQPDGWREPIGTPNPSELADQVARARTLARRLETKVAAISRKLEQGISESASLVHGAEAKVASADARVERMEQLAAIAEAKVASADARVERMEQLAAIAEAKVASADVRVERMEQLAAIAEAKVASADARVERMEQLAAIAEAKVTSAEANVASAEAKVTSAEANVASAEANVASAEASVARMEHLAAIRESQMAKLNSGLLGAVIKTLRRAADYFHSAALRLRLAPVREHDSTQVFVLGKSTKSIVLTFGNSKGSRMLAIGIPFPTSPEEQGSGSDNRRLGIGLIKLRIESIPRSGDTREIRFDRASWPEIIKRSEGLSDAETWGTWSSGNLLILEFHRPLPERFLVHLEALAFGPNIGKEFVAHLSSQPVASTKRLLRSKMGTGSEFKSGESPSGNNLTGSEADLDKLMIRIEDEVSRWGAGSNLWMDHTTIKSGACSE